MAHPLSLTHYILRPSHPFSQTIISSTNLIFTHLINNIRLKYAQVRPLVLTLWGFVCEHLINKDIEFISCKKQYKMFWQPFTWCGVINLGARLSELIANNIRVTPDENKYKSFITALQLYATVYKQYKFLHEINNLFNFKYFPLNVCLCCDFLIYYKINESLFVHSGRLS